LRRSRQPERESVETAIFSVGVSEQVTLKIMHADVDQHVNPVQASELPNQHRAAFELAQGMTN
jgi:hypothetical protein